MTRIIVLTRGKETLVDDADYEQLSFYSWYCLSTKNKEYATTSINGKTTHMHRMIMGLDGPEIDHEDGNGLNNQRTNLREATHQQNLANQKLSIANTTGFKGVIRYRGAYRAQTKYNQRCLFIGHYKTLEDAARAYDRKMIELHGEFAMTNEKLGLLPCTRA